MSTVTTSIVVNFDNSSGGQLSAEIDARPTGYNGGRTSFVAGDAPVILIFASSDVSIDEVLASAGVPGAVVGGVGTVEVSEDLQFTGSAEASLSKPFYNSFSYKWLGNNLGTPTPSENKVLIPAPGVGVLRIKYNALFTAYRISSVPSPLNGETTFPVLIVVNGTKAGS
jgi:hypothetical protein